MDIIIYNETIMRFSIRGILTLATLVLLALVVWAAWPEIKQAWRLMNDVELWLLALLIPIQFLSYYAAGSMIFSYLKAKGNLNDMSHWSMTRLALEFNFVNHVLPSGGAAGFSYMTWVLGCHKVPAARATMAQIVRLLLMFVSFVLLMLIAVAVLAVNDKVDRTIVGVTLLLTAATIGAVFFVVWLIQSTVRLQKFSNWITNLVNGFMYRVSRKKIKEAVKYEKIYGFLSGLHEDYNSIQAEHNILVKPFLWGMLANILDVGLIWVSFWALGSVVDPAVLFVAFGIASIAGALSVTPGGAGVYEAVMVAFLAATGVPPDVAIAGTLLARVILLAATIVFGYAFYQLTVFKYGKRPAER